MAKSKQNLEARVKAKDFNWCAIKGQMEPYCMTHICALCPANKHSASYNPNSAFIQAYREGRMMT